MKKSLFLGLVVCFTLLAGSGQANNLVESRVRRVIAGDVFKVEYAGAVVYARLIGVNLPQEQMKKTVDPAYIYNPEAAQKAKIFAVQKLTPAQKVYLEFDQKRRDSKGFLLVYLWLDKDGAEMFNELLLREGYGQVLVRPPNVKY
ncbi:MAG TPA: thermonuclease family protein, partial [bacterium]|nr:thermonuclease family protein [bacterium]